QRQAEVRRIAERESVALREAQRAGFGVLAIVEVKERSHAPARKLVRFEDGDAMTRLPQLVTGGQSGQAAAQYDDILRHALQDEAAAHCRLRYTRRERQCGEAQAEFFHEVSTIDRIRHGFSRARISPTMLQPAHVLCNGRLLSGFWNGS